MLGGQNDHSESGWESINSTLEKPSGYHFNQPGHNQSHLRGLVLEKVKSADSFVLKATEFYHIKNAFNNGLNKEP